MTGACKNATIHLSKHFALIDRRTYKDPAELEAQLSALSEQITSNKSPDRCGARISMMARWEHILSKLHPVGQRMFTGMYVQDMVLLFLTYLVSPTSLSHLVFLPSPKVTHIRPPNLSSAYVRSSTLCFWLYIFVRCIIMETVDSETGAPAGMFLLSNFRLFQKLKDQVVYCELCFIQTASAVSWLQ